MSPATARWGTAGTEFVVSGGENLKGKSFAAQLGGEDCVSAVVDAADPSKLNVSCDIPHGGPSSTLRLRIYYAGTELSGGGLSVALDWPPASGLASFDSALSSTSATWWQTDAQVQLRGGVNLPGHALTATMDGVSCSAVNVSSEDPGRLDLTCKTRPGGPGTTSRLLVQENGVTLPGGDVGLSFAECADPGAPVSGVPLPLLCNAAVDSTAAATPGFEGIWKRDFGIDALLLVAPNGEFLATEPSFDTFWGGRWTVSGSSWSPVSAERMDTSGRSAFTASGSYVPFRHIAEGAMHAASGLSVDHYAAANALAVSQAPAAGKVSVAGTWGSESEDITFTVDPTGSFRGDTSGTLFGTCTISGTIALLQPDRNMFSIALVASGGTACNLWQTNQLTGLAAIDVVNVGSFAAPVYAYQLVFIVRSAGQFYMVGSALRS